LNIGKFQIDIKSLTHQYIILSIRFQNVQAISKLAINKVIVFFLKSHKNKIKATILINITNINGTLKPKDIHVFTIGFIISSEFRLSKL
jgi:hypothetical protein